MKNVAMLLMLVCTVLTKPATAQDAGVGFCGNFIERLYTSNDQPSVVLSLDRFTASARKRFKSNKDLYQKYLNAFVKDKAAMKLKHGSMRQVAAKRYRGPLIKVTVWLTGTKTRSFLVTYPHGNSLGGNCYVDSMVGIQ